MGGDIIVDKENVVKTLDELAVTYHWVEGFDALCRGDPFEPSFRLDFSRCCKDNHFRNCLYLREEWEKATGKTAKPEYTLEDYRLMAIRRARHKFSVSEQEMQDVVSYCERDGEFDWSTLTLGTVQVAKMVGKFNRTYL